MPQSRQLADLHSALRVDERLLARLGEHTRAALSEVIAQPRGLIEVPSSYGRVYTTAVLAGVFGYARVLIVAASPDDADRDQRFLSTYRGKEPCRLANGRRATRAKCTVSSWPEIGRLRAGQYQVLILPDAWDPFGDAARSAVERLDCPRVYGLIPAGREDPERQAYLEQVIGPVVHRHEEGTAQVRVMFLPVPPVEIDRSCDALQRKRKGIWHNQTRNRLIAAVATAFAKRDKKLLARFDVPADLSIAPAELHGVCHVILFVESTEHGRALQRRLPDSHLLHRAADPDGQNEAGDGNINIVTTSFAQEHKIYADVIIRATGERGGVAFNGSTAYLDPTVERDALLIDFDDDYDAHAASDTEDRRDQYQRWGWSIIQEQRPPQT
ncbi:hypothetical protein AYO44_12845 [Planctomycetaceae bacterium SCGC AG-212-F19]|nr:hypothetical protein AYO44_12845 [Planctomycetaceae bacterium SCGC AG-212-F19]